MIVAGIDAGSRAIKVVVYDTDTGCIVGTGLHDQGVAQDDLAEGVLDRALDNAGLSRDDVASVVATGYGRNVLTIAGTTITEITCHARGVRHVVPDARTVIDIGGQDSKVIRLDEGGSVRDFAMNDRCAAGTGRFIEIVTERLEVGLDALGAMSRQSEAPAPISSMCVVFAETEIIGLLATGQAPENIVAGVQISIAKRVATMTAGRIDEPVVFTGGVALVPGMVDAISAVLDREVSIAPDPQFTGALGAALLAAEKTNR